MRRLILAGQQLKVDREDFERIDDREQSREHPPAPVFSLPSSGEAPAYGAG